MLNQSHIKRLLILVGESCGKLTPEDVAKVVAVAEANDNAVERAAYELERTTPDIIIRTIYNGCVVTARDNDGKPYDTAFVHADDTSKRSFEDLVWHIKDALCPDFGNERMKITFEKKD
jgi:hypothetical protein